MFFKVEFYEALNGKKYALEFIENLEIIHVKLYEATLGKIDSLADGINHRPPICEQLGKGLWELKSSFGNDITRINWCYSGKQKIFLLNGYVKKGKGMQQREIEKARKLMNEVRMLQGKDKKNGKR